MGFIQKRNEPDRKPPFAGLVVKEEEEGYVLPDEQEQLTGFR